METNTKEDLSFISTLHSAGFGFARMIAEHKSEYNREHPNHEVYFNANIFTKDGKQWYGDLDLTLDSDALQRVSNETGMEFAVLKEMDGRFEYDTLPYSEAEKKAKRVFVPVLPTL